MNWITIISDLINAGMTQSTIAAKCFCGQSTISDLFRGSTKHPNFELGSKLIALHKSISNKEALTEQ